jgi:RNA polymerase sigma-B factor
MQSAYPRPPGSDAKLLEEFAAQRSPRLLEQLVVRYRPLARSLALRYKGGSEPMDDLFQVAELGLVKALQGFDPERGRPFAAYAVPTILGEIKRHFRDRVWNLRLPRDLQETSMKVAKVERELANDLGRQPTIEEIADHLEIEVDAVAAALEGVTARSTLSLDAPRSDEEGAATVGDGIGTGEAGYDRVEAYLASETADLTERERLVLGLRFEHNIPQRAIGAKIGVSQMQISRISRSGLDKLLASVRGEPAKSGS